MPEMEDDSFQQQLHSLKDRVNALTLQYSPRPAPVAPVAYPSPPIPSGDAFTMQLQDLKAHLNTLQKSMSKYQTSMHQQSASRPSKPAADEMMAQSRLTLPSGPAFWQLFNSLRSDFQTLDTRVAGLEQDVDALEDRVDKLEPDLFTPAGSTASQEDSGGVQITQKPSQDLLGASMACLPELCSVQEDGFSSTMPGQHHRKVSSLQSQPRDAFEWQWPTGHHWSEDSMRRPYATPMFQTQTTYNPHEICGFANNAASVYPEGVAFRDREIDRMDDQLRIVQESLKSSEALAAAKDTTMSDMQAQIESLQAENRRMTAHMAKEAQSKRGQDVYIRQLRRGLEERVKAFQTREEERRRTNDAHLQTIAERDYAVRYWQERCDQEASVFQQHIADRDQALQRWEESYNAVNDAWRQESERAAALRSRLDHHRSNQRQEMQELHLTYEKEMNKLKEFCGHKDEVLVKQERVMARGGRLLEERDAEIDRLQRRIRAAEDDFEHERRQQNRMARLLGEAQTEVERLSSQSVPELKSMDNGSVTAQEHEQAMAASTEAVDGREPFERPHSREGRRAEDRRRERRYSGSSSSEASTREAARTGSPRPRRLTRHESWRRLQHPRVEDRNHRRERRPTPPPRPIRLPYREDRRERFVADKSEAQPALPDRRRARFLDDDVIFVSSPPPPAPAARKMASEADLRSANNAIVREAEAGKRLSKHQSMQELPGARGRLQAYVETEGESDAEKDAQQGRV